MEMRRYKDSGQQVSLLGFGCMRLPFLGEARQNIDYDHAGKMVAYAFENGVNYFDTAYPYHEGSSEVFVGEALVKKFPRDRFLLATKLPTWLVESEADAERLFDEQLRRCQVEYFDYYLIHNLNVANYGICEQFRLHDFVERKKREGKIRRYGFSFHDNPTVLARIVADHPWDFAQIQLNYHDWESQDAAGQYDILTRAGIPVIVMEPVRGGTLAAPGREAEEILDLAAPGASPASWAIRYAASLPNVLTVLSGMSTLDQVKDNVRTMGDFRPLSDSERAALGAALLAYRKTGAIPCTSCSYCMDCPSGVDIPKVFAVYNHYRAVGIKNYFDLTYRMLGEDKQADKCVKCGVCVPKCPQGIDIPARLEEVAAEAREAMES